VTEAKALVTGELRPLRADELFPDKRQQMAGDVVPQGGGGEVRDGAAVKRLPFDRRALEHAALAGVEPVDPSGEDGSDRRRDGDGGEVAALDPRAVVAGEQPLVDQHAQHLLDEERVASRRLGEPGPHVLGE
jgi:hypothetical protein